MTNKLKTNSTIQTILVTLFSFLFVTLISYAATTIGTNISTGGTLAVTGTTTLANASTTQLSVSNNLYTALTANSIPYITTSGLLTQDTSNLVWDGTNNRMGIGTSSPYAKLSIHANNGETNTTLFNIASSTASATTSLFTVLNNGNVGIGTDAPTNLLTVNPSVSNDGIVVFESDSNTVAASLTSDANEGFLTLKGGGQTVISLRTAGNNYFDLAPTRKFGIGDNSPDARLEVSLSGGSDDAFMLSSDDNNDGDLMIVKNSGFVGIGTSTPSSMFTVASTTVATTTVEFGDQYSTGGKACFNTKNAAGANISFYFSGTAMVVENNRCK